MSKHALPGIAALILIAALTSSPVPAGTTDVEVPQAGPARIAKPEPEPNDLGLPTGPPPVETAHIASGPQPLLSPEGLVVGSFTDGASGQPPQPLNRLEEAKLALARQAIAAAEAAGTRLVLLAEPPEAAASADDLERVKLERLAARTPPPMAQRPGASSAAAASPDAASPDAGSSSGLPGSGSPQPRDEQVKP